MKLLDYLNNLPKADRPAFAKRCGTTLGYLNNVAYGYKVKIGAEIAGRVEIESGGAVTIEEMPCEFPAKAFVNSRLSRIRPRGQRS